MDVRDINPFIDSVTSVFGTMCGLKVTVGKPQIKSRDMPQADVSGVIGF